MPKTNRSVPMRKYFLSVTLIVAMIAIVGNQAVAADEVPAFFLKIAKNIPRLGRSPHTTDFLDESNNHENQPYVINKRKIGYSSDIESRNWQHFPLAIEGPPELWRSLAGYSKDPLYSTTDDFNNEVWSRDKRAAK